MDGGEVGEVSADSSIDLSDDIGISCIDQSFSKEEADSIDADPVVKSVFFPKKYLPKQIPAAQRLHTLATQGGRGEEVLFVLNTLFGKDFIDRVLLAKGLLKECLDKKEVLRLLGEISNCFTVSDLDVVFAEIQANDCHREITHFIPRHSVWTWQWIRSVRELPSHDICNILELFENPLQCIDPCHPYHLVEELKREKLATQHSLICSTYNYDIEQLEKRGDRSRPEFFMAPQELLARNVAYADTRTTPKGTIIKMFYNGRLHLYMLKERVDHKGVLCSIFTPFTYNANLPIQVLFQGTCNEQGVKRIVDSSGVGKATFNEASPQIQQIIQNLTQGYQPYAKIAIAGHSLGGLDAQRCCIDLVDLTCKKQQIKEIDLFSFSSPRLDRETLERGKTLFSTLQPNTHNPKLRFSFAFHEKDLFAWSGGQHYLKPDKLHIPTTFLIVTSESGWTHILSHHSDPFFHDGNFDHTTDKRTFQLYYSVDESKLQYYKDKRNDWQNAGLLHSIWLYCKSCFSPSTALTEVETKIKMLETEIERWNAMHKKQSEHIKFWSVITNLFTYIFSLIIGSQTKNQISLCPPPPPLDKNPLKG